MTTPERLSPDELSARLGPWGSWPKDGTLPAGYFEQPLDDSGGEFFRENGYLVLHEALSPEEVGHLKAETARISRNADGAIGGIEPATAEVSDDEAMKRVLCIHFPHKLSRVFAMRWPSRPWWMCSPGW